MVADGTETASHSPAPWEMHPGEDYVEISDRGGRTILEVMFHYEDDSELSNFRLMTAAPELLELVERFYQWAKPYAPEGQHPLMVDARASIAKAKGGAA